MKSWVNIFEFDGELELVSGARSIPHDTVKRVVKKPYIQDYEDVLPCWEMPATIPVISDAMPALIAPFAELPVEPNAYAAQAVTTLDSLAMTRSLFFMMVSRSL